MKKTLTILAMLLMALVENASAADEVTWTDVSTAEELAAAVSANANIRLTEDIDLSGLSATKEGYLFDTFSGRITGEYTAGSGNDYFLKNSTHPLFYNLTGATIEHLNLYNFNLTSVTSLIARTSSSTNFSHIKVRKSALDAGTSGANVGMISGYSNGDTFSYCSVDEHSSVASEHDNTAGIAGFVENGNFTYCYNCANVTVLHNDHENAGGIAGSAASSEFRYCLNTGEICADSSIGGISGYTNITNAYYCDNTGKLYTNDNLDGDLGEIFGNSKGRSIVANCLGFGTINDSGSFSAYACPMLGSAHANDQIYDNIYYCSVNGNVKSNLSENNLTIFDISSGSYACSYAWLYQDIDNNTFPTHLPVPIAEAGEVHKDIRLCDYSGNTLYSNRFHNSVTHETRLDAYGYCSKCGAKIGEPSSKIHISSANGLDTLAYNLKNGMDLSNSTIYLDNDVDFDRRDYIPIGYSSTVPFKGIFDGRNHRVSNLVLYDHKNGSGLFGYAAGENTVIKNLVIDSSCHIESAGATGVAGIVGCVQTTSGSHNITLMNCGNEASVKGYLNVAGLLGVVYTNSNVHLNVYNCYNTGYISGNDASAAFIGYGYMNINIANCFNNGGITGWQSQRGLFGYNGNANITYSNLYNGGGSAPDDHETLVNTDQIQHGDICQKLNANRGTNTDWSAWTQDIAKDSHPTFGSGGLHYSRSMTNQWGTICLPFGTDIKADDKYDFYELAGGSNDALTLKKIEGTLKAGTPSLVRRNTYVTGIDIPSQGTTFAYKPATGSSAVGLTLTGAYTSTDITDKDGYIISGNAFWNIADIKEPDKVYCSPFHAYLAGSLSNGARQLAIEICDETPTAMETLNAITDGTAEYYDLNGRKLSALQEGINIVRFNNGTTRKIIIR